MNDILLKATGLKKSFSREGSPLEILKGVSLDVLKGDAISIMGSSGAGKSTLMHIMGTLDTADEGELEVEGVNIRKLKDQEMSHFRAQKMGFVFQFHHLLNEFTVLENVLMPFWILKEDAHEKEARDLLARVGLSDRLHHFPTQLSGGECQRVALARALVKKPKILFADEPTGNLDSQNGQIIQQLLFDLQKESGAALVVVTHDENLAMRFPKRLKLQDGRWVR
jgi:lipoprotein-releasing system ATP-binding protein